MPIPGRGVGRRIAVLGSGGAGKSTLARRLGGLLDLPVVHLDALFWHPGWVGTPTEEWVRIQEALVARQAWVIEGNYGGTLDIRLTAADTVVLMDLPRATCLWRTIRRSLGARREPRPDLAPGCPERCNTAYLRFLWWIWTYPSRRRPALLRRLEALPADKRVVRLRSDREVADWVGGIEGAADRAPP